MNQFYVQPPQFGQGLQSLAQGVGQFRQEQEVKAEKQQATQRQQEAQKAMQAAVDSGDPRMMQNVMVQFPEVQEQAKAAFGFTNEATEKVAREGYARAASSPDPEQAAQILEQTAAQIQQLGGRPVMTTADAQALRQDPEGAMKRIRSGFAMLASPQEFAAVMGEDSMLGMDASTRAFEARAAAAGLQRGTPEYEKAAMIELGMVPRAGMSAQERIATDPALGAAVAQQTGQQAAAGERGKLTTQLDLKPRVEAAVRQAVSNVEAAANIAKEERSNTTAMNTYEAAIGGLLGAMEGTTTGPVAGLIPAMSANAQIADGAVAIMAPVLKSMFRTAGEGTFTDKDQELLMSMIPTRKDLPEARAAKIAAIDTLVRAKLNQEPAARGNGAQDQPARQQTAPPAALNYLKANPGAAEQFKAKYGYLPEGF